MPLRITIRDLFWLALLVAMSIGWWFDHHRRPRYEVYDSAPGIIMGKYRTLVDNQTGDTWIERDGSWINTLQLPAQQAADFPVGRGGFGGGGDH